MDCGACTPLLVSYEFLILETRFYGGFTGSVTVESVGQFLACPGFLGVHSFMSSLSPPDASSDLPGQLSLSANLGSLHFSSVFGAGTAEACCWMSAGSTANAMATVIAASVATITLLVFISLFQ